MASYAVIFFFSLLYSIIPLIPTMADVRHHAKPEPVVHPLHLVTPPRPSAPPLFRASTASPLAAAPPDEAPDEAGGRAFAACRAASPAAAATSSDLSGFSNRAASPGGAGAGAGGLPALLPKHTRVRVTGNARTRVELLGLDGRILTRGGAGLGGWHLLVSFFCFVLF